MSLVGSGGRSDGAPAVDWQEGEGAAMGHRRGSSHTGPSWGMGSWSPSPKGATVSAFRENDNGFSVTISPAAKEQTCPLPQRARHPE